MKSERKPYRIAAAYDTETANICTNSDKNEWLAYPVLYIWNDLTETELATYEPDDTAIRYHRTGEAMQAEIAALVTWGRHTGAVPIVCAYNLMFDMQPIIYELSRRYVMRASAQSSTHVYTLDLYDDAGEQVLRFWDTYYLEMRGLEAMGETCGVAKATGSWDYSKVRTPETPLTTKELHYAARDVEVIPAYLRYLLEANAWLTPDMLGVTVLTKTSLVRQAGKQEVGPLEIRTRDGKTVSVQTMMQRLCASELAPTYAQYALRKACFRGGFTFTAAEYAGVVQRNVYSLDETSAHHAYINGHMLPVHFKPATPRVLDAYIKRVIGTPVEKVLEHYENPWGCAFHAQVRFKNIRLKRGTAFDAWGIATIAEGKFHAKGQDGEWGGESDKEAETSIRSAGYVDVAKGATFAFGKLYSARWAVLNVSEIELYIISMVYDFDSVECIFGEATCNFVKPPDYVTLLSNMLFERKQALKRIIKRYSEGVPYTGDIHPTIPANIAEQLRAGSMNKQNLESYYQSTVKGMFNSIYGTQSQDVFKPDYVVQDGKISVDPDSKTTRDNYREKYKAKRSSLVLYTYGLRIVGGSRLALVLAIEMLYEAFETRVRILGGDTDSIKIACDADIDGQALMEALAPFHEAVTSSIDVCMTRVRKRFPDYASTLDEVGTFEVEGEPYAEHMDAWNKARVSWDGKHAHVTCAGLSRPQGRYHIETWIEDRVRQGHPFAEVAPQALGWGVRVSSGVCHALERTHPEPWERAELDVTDYRGETSHVSSYQSIALYPSARVLGDVSQGSNARTVDYLRSLGRDVDTSERVIDAGGAYRALDEWGWHDI